MAKEKQDNTERGPKPMSDEEIRESVMGQNTEYQNMIDRARNGSGDGSRRKGDDD